MAAKKGAQVQFQIDVVNEEEWSKLLEKPGLIGKGLMRSRILGFPLKVARFSCNGDWRHSGKHEKLLFEMAARKVKNFGLSSNFFFFCRRPDPSKLWTSGHVLQGLLVLTQSLVLSSTLSH